MVTFDIKEIYVNIPIEERINFLKAKLLENNTSDTSSTKSKSITELFYISTKICQPEQSISMRSPISSLIAEIFLQHYEDIHIKQLLDTKNIALYTRYVDDILIIYDITKIQPQTINTHINKIHDEIL